MQTKRENRGGKRPGAGRKPTTFSQARIKAMLESENTYETKFGKSVNDILLDIIYNNMTEEVDVKSRVSAIKLWKDKTHVEVKAESESDRALGQPGVYLPEQRPDPVKLKVI